MAQLPGGPPGERDREHPTGIERPRGRLPDDPARFILTLDSIPPEYLTQFGQSRDSVVSRLQAIQNDDDLDLDLRDRAANLQERIVGGV